jgi:hypothetical protein
MLELGKTTKEYIFSNFRVNIYKQPTKDLILHVAMLLNVFKIVYIVSECWREMKSSSPKQDPDSLFELEMLLFIWKR